MDEVEQTGESEKVFCLRIKGNSYELSASGSLAELTTSLDDIAEFITKLNNIVETEISAEIETPTDEEIRDAPSSEVPIIKATRKSIDNIALLFETEWGRTPRNSAEVAKALDVNAVPDSATAVSRP